MDMAHLPVAPSEQNLLLAPLRLLRRARARAARWWRRRLAAWQGFDAAPPATGREELRFDQAWKNRAAALAAWLAPGETVLDIGCGPMALKNLLPPGCRHLVVDCRDRGSDMVLADFHAFQFPDLQADVAVLSGVLEFADPLAWLLAQAAARCGRILFSYCPAEKLSQAGHRRSRGWRNHLRLQDLHELLGGLGMTPSRSRKFDAECVLEEWNCSKAVSVKTASIPWLDPSGEGSHNLGNAIIANAVRPVLGALFPGRTLAPISMHHSVGETDRGILDGAPLLFIGGTNSLSSDVQTSNVCRDHASCGGADPPLRRCVLFGVGWGRGWNESLTARTRAFYESALSRCWLHSVRDEHTARRLRAMGFDNVLFTGCPSAWGLHGRRTRRQNVAPRRCLFTVNGHLPKPQADDTVLRMLAACSSMDEFVFFPQGELDAGYLAGLPAWERLRHRTVVLPRSIAALQTFITTKTDGLLYVGTRLHAGIFCLDHGVESLILALDQRAPNMAQGTNLPVIARGDLTAMRRWMDGDLDFGTIQMPLDAIARWKAQFNAPQPAGGLVASRSGS